MYIYMAMLVLFLHTDFGADGYRGKVLVQIANGSVQIAAGDRSVSGK